MVTYGNKLRVELLERGDPGWHVSFVVLLARDRVTVQTKVLQVAQLIQISDRCQRDKFVVAQKRCLVVAWYNFPARSSKRKVDDFEYSYKIIPR